MKNTAVYVPKVKQPEQQQNDAQPQQPVVVAAAAAPVVNAAAAPQVQQQQQQQPRQPQPPRQPKPVVAKSPAAPVVAGQPQVAADVNNNNAPAQPTAATAKKERGPKPPREKKERPPKKEKVAKVDQIAVAPAAGDQTAAVPPASPSKPAAKPRAPKPPRVKEPKPAAAVAPAAADGQQAATPAPRPAKAPKQPKEPKAPKPAASTTTTTTSTNNRAPKQSTAKTPAQPKVVLQKKPAAVKDDPTQREREAKKKEEEARLEMERKIEIEKIRLEQERIQAEEDERRREQERIEQEEERKKQEQLALERLAKQKEELEAMLQMRTQNMKANKTPRPEPKDLDTNFKRITNFLKKLKTFSDKDNLLQESLQLNLSKYTTEIVPSVIKSTFKTNDIPAIVKLFSALYLRYEGVDTAVAESISQVFQPLAITAAEPEIDRNAKITKRRNIIRLMMDLYYVDIIHSYSPINKLIGKMINSSTFEQDKDAGYPTLMVLNGFLRPASQFIGLAKKERNSSLPDIYSNILTPEEQTATRDLVLGYFTKIGEFIQKEQQLLRDKEKEMKAMMMAKGELTEAFSTSYEAMRRNYEKLITNGSLYAEMIGETAPSNDYTTKLESDSQEQKTDALEVFDTPWENEEQRVFYEVLVPLPSRVVPDADKDKDKEKDSTTTTVTSPPKVLTENEKKALKTKSNIIYEDVIQLLRSSVLKASVIDNAVLEFVKLTLKQTKKKNLIQLLANARQDQIPFFARFVASLNQGSHHKEFVNTFKQNDITFIGEMIKFKVLPSSCAFNYLKLCFDDFTHHNVDIACTLLEVCGRHLYKCPDTQFRLKNMLDILIRNKNAKMMETRQESLIDNAYLSCRPLIVKKKNVDPIRQFTKFLIFRYLSEENLKKVFDKILQLPWPQCQDYLAKYLLDVQKGKFGNIYLVADILYRLKRHYPVFVRSVIWRLIEDITLGFERSDFNLNQKRIMQATLFGELYNSCLLSSFHIFTLLKGALEYNYSTMHLFPVNADREKEFLKNRYKPNLEDFDPINDTFRIRFICSLILVCKDCFSEREIQTHLKPYLLFLQRYALTKRLSLELDFMLSDCLQIVPDIKIFKTWEEANEECSKSSSVIKVPSEEDDEKEANNPTTTTRRKDTTANNTKNNTSLLNNNDEEEEVEESQQYMRQQQEETEEDLEFLREFKRTVQESTDSRKNERSTKLNLPSILSSISASGLTNSSDTNATTHNQPSPSFPSPFTSKAPGNIQFKLLLKKGNKPATKSIEIPEDFSFVSQIKNAKEEEERNILENKKLVLKLTQQQNT
eukprot:gene4232-4937_t